MVAALVLIHLLAFAIGVGGAVASLLLIARARAREADAAALRSAVPQIGLAGAWAVLVLWLTGLALFGVAHDFDAAALGPWFTVKVALAALLAGLVVASRLILRRLARGADPALKAWPPRLVRLIAATGTLTAAAAVLAFRL